MRHAVADPSLSRAHAAHANATPRWPSFVCVHNPPGPRGSSSFLSSDTLSGPAELNAARGVAMMAIGGHQVCVMCSHNVQILVSHIVLNSARAVRCAHCTRRVVCPCDGAPWAPPFLSDCQPLRLQLLLASHHYTGLALITHAHCSRSLRPGIESSLSALMPDCHLPVTEMATEAS